jgi:hypothetical protein
MIGQSAQNLKCKSISSLGRFFEKFGVNLLGHPSLIELKEKRNQKEKEVLKITHSWTENDGAIRSKTMFGFFLITLSFEFQHTYQIMGGRI